MLLSFGEGEVQSKLKKNCQGPKNLIFCNLIKNILPYETEINKSNVLFAKRYTHKYKSNIIETTQYV